MHKTGLGILWLWLFSQTFFSTYAKERTIYAPRGGKEAACRIPSDNRHRRPSPMTITHVRSCQFPSARLYNFAFSQTAARTFVPVQRLTDLRNDFHMSHLEGGIDGMLLKRRRAGDYASMVLVIERVLKYAYSNFAERTSPKYRRILSLLPKRSWTPTMLVRQRDDILHIIRKNPYYTAGNRGVSPRAPVLVSTRLHPDLGVVDQLMHHRSRPPVPELDTPKF
ncbi:hypothetical protein BS50DRAFT_190789 [Corynespora cassiicola Philippines]|uniref:Uncharacterized protein n=1 Tax=Corynespora cassiicola Philippines TaxID=1448308 RepID=A0A2T2P7H1_CORCC|nr:hypothetical protein BS50DRAFT_190789 [Corynespora cassiicola Philippines]